MLRQKTLFFLALLLCFTATVAWADSQARIVRLSYIEGNVQMDRGDGNGYIRAFLNMPVIEGTRLLTGPDARTEVEFEDGSTARLVPDTIIFFSTLRLTDNGDKISTLDVQQGMAYFDVKQRREDNFRVTSGRLELSPVKSSRFRISNNGAEFRVAVFNGELEFVNTDGQRVSLRKNETLNIDYSDAGRYYLARGTTEEANDYWDKERDSDRQTYARKVSYGGYSNGSYINDLSPYGSFVTIGSYGSLWRPFGVGFGWDPFDYGSWVYYPGTGYIWVSGYSWGWAPYRYGSWVFLSNGGWYWQPGRGIFNRWSPLPVIVNAPRGYVLPIRPRHDINPVPIIRGRRGLDPLDRLEEHDRLGSGDHRVFVQDRVRPTRDLAQGEFVPARTPTTITPPASGGIVNDRVRSPRVSGVEPVMPAGGSVTGDVSGRVRPARNSDAVTPIIPIRTNDSGAPTPRTREVPHPSEAPPRVVDQPVRPQRIESPPPERSRPPDPRPAPVQTPPPAPAPPPAAVERSRPQRVDPPPPPPPQARLRPTDRMESPQRSYAAPSRSYASESRSYAPALRSSTPDTRSYAPVQRTYSAPPAQSYTRSAAPSSSSHSTSRSTSSRESRDHRR